MAVPNPKASPLSPFEEFLNLRIKRFQTDGVILVLPAQEATLNIGGTLHGGASVSLALIGARRALEAQLGAQPKPMIRILDQQVQFLGTTRLEEVKIHAKILKRGRELAFAEVELVREDGHLVSKSLLSLRYGEQTSGTGKQSLPAPIHAKDHVQGDWQPGPFSAPLAAKGFGSTLGQRVVHMRDHRSIVELPIQPYMLDSENLVDPAALGALADSTGAMACWSLMQPGLQRAATTAIHLNYYSQPAAEKLYGLGIGRWRYEESLASRFQIVGALSGQIVAEGQLLFRVVAIKNRGG